MHEPCREFQGGWAKRADWYSHFLAYKRVNCILTANERLVAAPRMPDETERHRSTDQRYFLSFPASKSRILPGTGKP
jgi:hypothetical protein